jgi:hypothetical protein
MKNQFSLITVAAISMFGIMFGIAGAAAGELPTYDIAGLPITSHQMSVLGLSAHIQEQAAAPTLMLGGMPASPHQISVLTRHPRTSDELTSPRSIEAAASQFGAAVRSE